MRAALRAAAWPDVLAAIDAMPRAEQQEPAWRYWKARALAATGDATRRDALYAALAGESELLRAARGRGARPAPTLALLRAIRRRSPTPTRWPRSARARTCSAW